MLTPAKAAAEVMVHLCYHDAHGYSQPARKGDGTTETVELSDGTKVQVHNGDYDCSEAVRTAWAAIGVLPKDSYMWTGNEPELLKAHDFAELPFRGTTLEIGDVLYKAGHTEIYVGNGLQAGFHADEKGGIGNGAKQGDQTGYESYLKPVQSYWERVYRYKGTAMPEGWVKNSTSGKWWYRNADGSYPCDEWKRIAGYWYHFDSKGWMQTGWLKIGKTWYYLQKSGAMLAKCCAQINGSWYVFKANGEMETGQVTLNANGSIKF